jgi:glutathione S-transferase
MSNKGLAAQERFVNLEKGAHRSAAFLAINPLGAIPALIEEGHAPLTQSLAILEFLVASERETGKFCHGDTPTIADICLVSIWTITQAFDINIEEVPTIERIVKNCAALDTRASSAFRKRRILADNSQQKIHHCPNRRRATQVAVHRHPDVA